MKNSIIFLILFFVPGLIVADTGGNNGVLFELTVRQKPAGIDKYFEITKDSLNVPEGRRTSGFLVNMNIDIELIKADSQSASISLFLTTIGKDIFHVSERYKIEYNLPARIENIPGKGGTVYQLLISPRERVAIDSSCIYYADENERYTISPTSHFDIHYVPYSLGEYHWTNVRTYLEEDFELFSNAFNIQSSSKTNVFLIPCPVSTIAWDKRFGYSLNPGRKNINAIYNHNFVSIDALLPNLLILYHNWGYAPPFLAEGIASYFDFPEYKMKKLKQAGVAPEIKNLLTYNDYMEADPASSEIMAASFCKYLIDKYGMNKIRGLYETTDDLNIKRNIELLYERPLEEIQSDWLHYIDTLVISRELFDHYARKASILYRSNEQIEYLEKMTGIDANRVDSSDTWSKLSTVYYQYGQFDKAIAGYRLLMKLDGPNSLYKLILGNLYLINGAYDSAYTILDSVYTEDTTRATAKLVQARIDAIRGDTAKAVAIAEEYLPKEPTSAGQSEFLIFLADIYNTDGQFRDTSRATIYYQDALTRALDMIAQVPQEPLYKLRAGIACFGLKRYGEAQSYLEVSLFTEKRTYFLARALLKMGNLIDVKGDHKLATEYYKEARELPLAEYDRAACMHYIDNPYKN